MHLGPGGRIRARIVPPDATRLATRTSHETENITRAHWFRIPPTAKGTQPWRLVTGGLAGAICAAVLVAMGPLLAQTPPVIAAASDLRFALEEIAARFTAQTGEHIKLSFGSSGNFRRQITRGAPYQVYLSADEGYVLALHREGFTQEEGTLYALGRSVIIAPRGSALGGDARLKGLAKALQDGTLDRFAIANPRHAPYGRAAHEALSHTGLWEAIESRLVLGENVSQAAQFATSGSTQGASSPTRSRAHQILHR